MNIDAVHRHMIWCGTPEGEILPVDIETGAMPPVETYPYIHVRFPLVVQTKVYKRDKDGHYTEGDRIATLNASVNEELVLAMATGGWSTRPLRLRAKIPLHEAMIIVSEACGRCLNVLAYEYGLSWGFKEGSDEWLVTKTTCEMCEKKS